MNDKPEQDFVWYEGGELKFRKRKKGEGTDWGLRCQD